MPVANVAMGGAEHLHQLRGVALLEPKDLRTQMLIGPFHVLNPISSMWLRFRGRATLAP
jgi:hypothetical protein